MTKKMMIQFNKKIIKLIKSLLTIVKVKKSVLVENFYSFLTLSLIFLFNKY
jgi:hypothetical protein